MNMNTVAYYPYGTDVWVMWENKPVQHFIRSIHIAITRDHGVRILYMLNVDPKKTDAAFTPNEVFLTREELLNNL